MLKLMLPVKLLYSIVLLKQRFVHSVCVPVHFEYVDFDSIANSAYFVSCLRSAVFVSCHSPSLLSITIPNQCRRKTAIFLCAMVSDLVMVTERADMLVDWVSYSTFLLLVFLALTTKDQTFWLRKYFKIMRHSDWKKQQEKSYLFPW